MEEQNTQQNKEEQTQQPEQAEQKPAQKSSMAKKLIGPLVALLIVAGAGFWAVSTDKIDLGNFTPGGSKEFVATVNGEGIEKRMFDTRFEQTKTAQGITEENAEQSEALRQQVLDSMINETLLVQYGQEQGLEVSQEEIDTNYQQIAGQFENEQEFESQLSAQGVTPEDIRMVISQDLILQQVVEKQAADHNVQVSEEEVRQVYDDAANEEGAELPAFEEVRGQIEQFVRQQKVSQLMQDLIAQLRADASIEIVS